MRPFSLNSTGPTPTTTPTRTLGMRLSCNFVNVYTIVHVYTRIPNGHPREKKLDKSRRTSRRAERASPSSARSEIGEKVRVGVGPVEFKLYTASCAKKNPHEVEPVEIEQQCLLVCSASFRGNEKRHDPGERSKSYETNNDSRKR